MAFIAPWTDFIFSGIILGNNDSKSFTIAYGLYTMVFNSKVQLQPTLHSLSQVV
jgi:arabinogalactan oligomer/maltooligosaccharide transport system permease protein